jgi:hypothetical protein
MASFEKTMNVRSFPITVSNTMMVDRIKWIGARNEIRWVDGMGNCGTILYVFLISPQNPNEHPYDVGSIGFPARYLLHHKCNGTLRPRTDRWIVGSHRRGVIFSKYQNRISIAAKTVLTSRFDTSNPYNVLAVSSANIGHDLLLSARSDPQQQSTTRWKQRHSSGLLFLDSCFTTVGQGRILHVWYLENAKPRNCPLFCRCWLTEASSAILSMVKYVRRNSFGMFDNQRRCTKCLLTVLIAIF